MAHFPNPKHEPSRLLCPITHTMFRDPVFTDSGNTYERFAIVQYWTQQGEIRDPLHNTLLKSASLKPNWDKRRDVVEFLQEWPDYCPEDWMTREVPPPDEDMMARTNLPSPGVRRRGRSSSARLWLLLVLLFLLLGAIVIWFSVDWDSRVVSLVPAGGGPSRNVSIRHATKEMASMSLGELLGTMEAHPAVDKVQSHGCLQLRKLATDHQEQVSIASMGGIPRIIDALRAHPSDEDVQTNCCGALWNLAIDASNQALILSTDGLVVIEAALQAHPGAARVQRAGTGALWNLGTAHDHAKKLAESLNSVQLVFEAMRAHPRMHDVQRNACGVLRILAPFASTQAPLHALGGMQILQDVIQAHHQAAEVRWHCCGALSELTKKSAAPENAEVDNLCSDAGRIVREVEL